LCTGGSYSKREKVFSEKKSEKIGGGKAGLRAFLDTKSFRKRRRGKGKKREYVFEREKDGHI